MESTRRMLTEDDPLPTRMPSGLADDGGCRLYTSSMCSKTDAFKSYPAGVDPGHTLVLVHRDVTTYGSGARERIIQQAFTAENQLDFYKWGKLGSVHTQNWPHARTRNLSHVSHTAHHLPQGMRLQLQSGRWIPTQSPIFTLLTKSWTG